MRILVIHPGPAFSVADVWAGWVEGLADIGCDVHSFNLDDRLTFYSNAGFVRPDGEFVHAFDAEASVAMASQGLHATMLEWQPDIVLVISCMYLPLDTLDLLRARGAKVVIVATEEPYEADKEIIRAAHADLNILNDPTYLERFNKVAPSIFMGHSYRPTVHHPGPIVDAMASDFCFVGTGFPSRVKFLEAVDWTGIDVALGGMWQTLSLGSPLRKFVAHDLEHCMANTETADAYRSTKTSANLYREEANRPEFAKGWACGPREIELAACNTFFARQSRPESDSLFPMLPVFKDPCDLEDIIRWAIDHPDETRAAAAAAWAAIHERTFAANAAQLLRILDTNPQQHLTKG